MWNKKLKTKAGVGLVEVIIGVAIIASAVLTSFFYFGFATKAARKSTEAIQVASLLEEGAEAIRIMRDNSWTNLASLNEGQDYYLEFSGGTWVSTESLVLIDNKFERSFSVYPVYRDSNDDIVASGGGLDPDTKRLEIRVSWGLASEPEEERLLLYMTNLFE